MFEFPGWRKAIIEFYGAKCMQCHRTDVKLHIDHVVPISKGGAHAVWNMQVLCREHNMAKGNKNSIDYRTGPKLIALVYTSKHCDIL